MNQTVSYWLSLLISGFVLTLGLNFLELEFLKTLCFTFVYLASMNIIRANHKD